jgi:hypothetical protein
MSQLSKLGTKKHNVIELIPYYLLKAQNKILISNPSLWNN